MRSKGDVAKAMRSALADGPVSRTRLLIVLGNVYEPGQAMRRYQWLLAGHRTADGHDDADARRIGRRNLALQYLNTARRSGYVEMFYVGEVQMVRLAAGALNGAT